MAVLVGSVVVASWGMRPTAATLTSVRTLSGTDAIVSEFGEHAVSAPLAGSQIVLEKPVAFMPSAAVESGGGADRIEFSELAKVGVVCVAPEPSCPSSRTMSRSTGCTVSRSASVWTSL